MDMTTLFSTPERERIMDHLLYATGGKKTMRQIAEEVSVSPSQVHKYLAILRDAGMVKGMALQDSPLVRSIRLMRNIIRLDNASVVRFLKKQIPGLRGVGIFGSWAEGSNTGSSDLDIWVKADKEPPLLVIAETRRGLEKRIGVAVDLAVLDEKRIKAHLEKNPPFYFSLYYSKALWGETI